MQVAESLSPERAPRERAADAGLYREEASRLRCRAQGTEHPQIQRNLIKIAEQYEQLADTIDRHSTWR